MAGGSGTSETARRIGVTRPTVIKWRDRFAAHGMAGLDDEPRSGRPKQIDDAAIIQLDEDGGRDPAPRRPSTIFGRGTLDGESCIDREPSSSDDRPIVEREVGAQENPIHVALCWMAASQTRRRIRSERDCDAAVIALPAG